MSTILFVLKLSDGLKDSQQSHEKIDVRPPPLIYSYRDITRDDSESPKFYQMLLKPVPHLELQGWGKMERGPQGIRAPTGLRDAPNQFFKICSDAHLSKDSQLLATPVLSPQAIRTTFA
ncbi:hypothetical protein NPIL_633671 [Nephila pilipes]|uniref:Uncharacterized protein n=1 Tax=Nephila pilipes TaxID=299642 RepID=A0A8X6PIQ0_NEPPI|nr:hypothetical protein NPIL_633671 [Nephila pilipes]